MINPPEIRFKAGGPQVARARQALFPLRLRVQCAGAEQALAKARRVLAQLRQAAEGASLGVPDPEADGGQQAPELTIEQKSPREVRLQLMLTLSLDLGEADGFWGRAGAIARAADLLQGFASQTPEKDVEIDVQQGRLADDGPSRPRPRGDEAESA